MAESQYLCLNREVCNDYKLRGTSTDSVPLSARVRGSFFPTREGFYGSRQSTRERAEKDRLKRGPRDREGRLKRAVFSIEVNR